MKTKLPIYILIIVLLVAGMLGGFLWIKPSLHHVEADNPAPPLPQNITSPVSPENSDQAQPAPSSTRLREAYAGMLATAAMAVMLTPENTDSMHSYLNGCVRIGTPQGMTIVTSYLKKTESWLPKEAPDTEYLANLPERIRINDKESMEVRTLFAIFFLQQFPYEEANQEIDAFTERFKQRLGNTTYGKFMLQEFKERRVVALAERERRDINERLRKWKITNEEAVKELEKMKEKYRNKMLEVRKEFSNEIESSPHRPT